MAQSLGDSNAHLDRLTAARDAYRALLTAAVVSQSPDLDTTRLDDRDTGPAGTPIAEAVRPARPRTKGNR